MVSLSGKNRPGRRGQRGDEIIRASNQGKVSKKAQKTWARRKSVP